MLAWIDLETTGLDPSKTEVLEIACIVTDDQLNEVARFHQVVRPCAAFDTWDPYIQQMHTASGLAPDVARAVVGPCQADGRLETFLKKHAPDAQLAGSTISFDRAFMAAHLPRALSVLHYRNLDVSTLNEVGRRFWPELYTTRPNNPTKAHRAMDDIEESIRVARHYIDHIAYVIEEGPASPAGEPIA